MSVLKIREDANSPWQSIISIVGPPGPQGPPGDINELELGNGLKFDNDGRICVDTADEVEEDNSLPITSAAVFVELGNVEALLHNI